MNAAAYTARYVERFNFALVPLHGKAPYHLDWQLDRNLIRTPEAARAHWIAHPRDNVGACLEPSGLVSLDADYLEGARQVLGSEGIDIDALIRKTSTIIGRAPRLEFRAPPLPLSRKALTWPPRGIGAKPVTVFELRAGRCQDVLPPSIHPETGQPYRWITPPINGFPPLPDTLLSLWIGFDEFKPRARNMCPWAPLEPPPEPRHAGGETRAKTGRSVISEFNAAHDAAAILDAHGYIRAGARRWKSPNGHGIAGVVQLPDGKIFCHHASDPLGDEKPHDAFDLFAQLEHHGNVSAAVRAAAELLGMNTQGRAA